MIARLTVAVPFNMLVPADKVFQLRDYEDDGYTVRVRPPGQTDVPVVGNPPESALIDGDPAFVSNGLTIDFLKEAFNRRRGGEPDPPKALIVRALNSFLARLRYVTRGHLVQQVNRIPAPWRLRYLNDDESELQEDPELCRGLGSLSVTWSSININASTWQLLYELPPDYVAPVWDDLRLDAIAALPRVGTSIVLAFAALETFIAHILDALAAHAKIDDTLWKWINNRGNFLKDPSTEEQFDFVLRLLTGHSLADDTKLWQIFTNLRGARNRFVHEGVARIGKNEPPLTEEQASGLVVGAGQIIDWTRQWLPDEVKWQQFTPVISVEMQHTFAKGVIMATKAETLPDPDISATT
jgi:hypothetical protein